MAQAIGLIFPHFSMLLCFKMCQPEITFCFPLCSIPFSTIVRWQFVIHVLWLQREIWFVAEAGILMLGRLPNVFNITGNDTLTFHWSTKGLKEIHTLTSKSSIFCTLTRLIVQMLFMLFSIYNVPLKMGGYEANQLQDFLLTKYYTNRITINY